MKQKTLKEIFEERLIIAFRAIAIAVCHDLKVKFRSFKVMEEDDPCSKTDAGYNSDGDIRISLKNYSNNRYYSLYYLIDTVVHEVVHLVHYNHSKHFWELHKQCMKAIRKELKDIPIPGKRYRFTKDHIKKSFKNNK